MFPPLSFRRTSWCALAWGLVTSFGAASGFGATSSYGATSASLELRPEQGPDRRLDFTTWPRFEVLSTEEGLSSPRINDIFQDSRGFLWIATADGLNRYDGRSLDVFRHDPEDPASISANYISEVAEDRHGKLWLRFGVEGLDRFDPESGRFEHFRPEPHHAVGFERGPEDQLLLATADRGWIEIGPPEGAAKGTAGLSAESPSFRYRDEGTHRDRRVRCWWREPSGQLWYGTDSGLFVWPAGEPARQVDMEPVLALCRSRNDLWVSRRGSRLDRLDRETGRLLERWNLSSGRSGQSESNDYVRLHVDGRGQIWTVDPQGRLFLFDTGSGRLVPHSMPGPVMDLESDDRGFVAAATTRGLAIYDPREDQFQVHRVDSSSPRSLRSHELREVFIDRDDNVWLTTLNSGVQRWNRRATAFRHRAFQDAGAPREVAAVAVTGASSSVESTSQLWLGVGNELIRIDPTTLSTLEALPLPDGAVVTALAAGRGETETLWVGTSLGPYRMQSDGRLERCPVPSALQLPINTLLLDSQGELWLGTSGGLWRWSADQPTPRPVPAFSPGAAAISVQVQALAEDGNGDIWIGTYVGGLSRINRTTQQVTDFVQSEDPSSLNNRSVQTLFVDSQNRVWVGTYSGGLDLYISDEDGFRHWTERDGLSGNQVSQIFEDDAGRIWAATNQGLSRLDPESGSIYSFNRRDGLFAQPFSQHAGTRGPDGTFLVGGHAGLIAFDPTQVETPITIPRLVWKDVRIDGEVMTSHASDRFDSLVLQPEDRSVSFQYVGLDYSNPDEVRYATRLLGFDDGWVECGRRDFASFTNLDAGEYRFQVRAAGSGGVWSEPVEVGFTVVPPFYRRGGFLLSALAVVALALWVAHSVRLRRQIARARLHERIRFAEREYIREQVARDYHDELGHKLTKLGIFADLLRRGIDSTNRDELVHYADRTGELVESLSRKTREFIWSIDPSKDSAFDLAELVGRFGHDLFEGSGIQFRLTGLEDELKSARLAPDWKRQLVLLLQEALHNSLRHSNASQVELIIGRVGPGLEIEVRDDGRGFDITDRLGRDGTQSGSGSWSGTGSGSGLRNMKRRAQAIGASLEVRSNPGRGTSLRLRAEAS